MGGFFPLPVEGDQIVAGSFIRGQRDVTVRSWEAEVAPSHARPSDRRWYQPHAHAVASGMGKRVADNEGRRRPQPAQNTRTSWTSRP